MKIVLIRHGQTAANRDRRFLGRTDEPLTEESRHDLAGRKYPQVRHLFSSPLLRCRQTAAIIYPDMESTVIDDLQEMDFGIFEGLNYQEMTGNAEYQKWVDGMCRGKCPGGESMPEFVDRVFAAFDDAAREAIAAGEKQMFVAAHGGTVMALLSRCGVPEKDYYDWFVKNGQGYVVHLDEKSWVNDPVLTAPVKFESLSALPEERIVL